MYWQYQRILNRAMREATPYRDIAMTPVQESEFEELEIYTAKQASKLAVEKLLRRKIADRMTNG
jgi:hypothetical protein